jgi:glycosyltransferase involved in cell wall biosynthesis
MHSLFEAVPPAGRFQIWDHPVLSPQADLAAHFHRHPAPPRPRPDELAPELKTSLDAFLPDVLYCAAVSPHLLQLTWEIQRHFQCPLVLHVMDDWPHWDILHTHPSATCFLKNSWFERLGAAAVHRAAISPLMAQEYESQTGFPWEVFHHSIDLEHYSSQPPPSVRKIFRIGYVGSLRRMFHGDCFEDLLELLAEKKLPNAELTIHTASVWAVDYQRAFGSGPQIHFAPPVTQAQLPAVLAGFDVLFLPLTFHVQNNAITRLSLPTKLGEYLAARRPIVIYGPPDTATHRVVQDWPLAFVQTNRDKAGLAATFAKAFANLQNNHSVESLIDHPVFNAFDRSKTVKAWTQLLRSTSASPGPASSSCPRLAPILPSGYLPAQSNWTVPAGAHPTGLEIELCQTKSQIALVSQHNRQRKIPAIRPGHFSLPVESSELEIVLAPSWKPRDLGLAGFDEAPPIAGYVRSWRWI